MKQLVLIRHGETTWNAERRIQGHGGGGLSDRGRAQATATADWLAETYPDAVVYCSDLQRCVETAQPLLASLGREATYTARLRERDFGAWTGLLAEEVADQDEARFARWRDGEDVLAEIGGEPTSALAARVVSALEDIAAGLDEGATAICVTHGGPIWHGTHGFVGLPHGSLGAVANAGITELADDASWGRRLLSWNQVAHLPVPLRTILRTADVGRPRRETPPVGR